VRIYTLGSGELSQDGFAKILSKYQIQVVADIRLSSSGRPGQLKREEVQRLCSDNKVEYIYLGNELGFVGSDKRSPIDPALYSRGLGILESLARTRGLLILGNPRSPERCSRRKIAEELAKGEVEVVHLLDVETVWQPSQKSKPQGEDGRYPGSRFGKGQEWRNRDRRQDGRNPQGPGQRGRDERPPMKKRTGHSKMDKAG